MILRKLTCLLASFTLVACSTSAEDDKIAVSANSRPNILIAIADDWSYGDATIDGSTYVNTPAFDRVAQEGVRFDNMYTPNAKCAPSRSILLTGRQSWQLEQGGNHWSYFPEKFHTWFEALSGMGYSAGVTGKGWAPGVALNADGEPRDMTGKRYDDIRWESPSKHISDIDYAANFGAFLDENEASEGEEPWVFWYGAQEPHRGFELNSGADRGGKTKDMIAKVPGYWPDSDEVRTDLLDYAYEVEHFDTHLERMIADLEARGELENTIIIVTSDHGKAFPRVKGQAYFASNRVPFAVRWPAGVEGKGRRVSEFVNFAEVAATVFDLIGLDSEDSTMQPLTGLSFANLLRSTDATAPERDSMVVGKERHDIGRPDDVGYPMRGLIKNGFLYIRNFEPTRWPAGDPITGYLNSDGGPTKTKVLDLRRKDQQKYFWDLNFGRRPAEELYDLAKDPDNVNNLAGESSQKDRLEGMRKELFAKLEKQGDPRMAGKGNLFDEYKYADTKHQDFYNRYIKGEKLTGMHWVSPTDFEDPHPDFE